MFSNDTPPEEIDFFSAVFVYLHVLHNLPYDELSFRPLEERILQEWPDILLYRPGVERGERRGFQDSFDRIFEDGFGVIYPYGVLRPSLNRRRLRYREYRDTLSTAISSPLPMYSHYLDEFLDSGRIEEAIQILQALAAVVVVWPTEGLLTLKAVIGHPHPRIRRATVRILAEAFNRHPDETMQFINSSGAAVSDDDLMEFRIRQDARIGRRQVSEEEWARIGHFLFRRPHSREVFIRCLRALLSADSMSTAVDAIFQTLGLAAGR